MAPARKKRQNEYFDVGVQGRRTGLTLPENTRDSFGVENIDGVFSSPEKSPARLVPVNGNTTLFSTEMDVVDDSVPEPTHVLNSRKLLRSTKSSLPPPSARSPFKTNIGSSPRRRSSVAPQSARKPVTRRLNFRADEPRPSIEDPERSPSAQLNGSRSSVDVYELHPTPPRSQKRSHSQMDEKEDSGIGNDYDALAMDALDESVAFVNGNDDGYDDDLEMVLMEQDPEIEVTNGEVQSSPIIQKKKRSRINGVEDSMMNGNDMIIQDADPYEEAEQLMAPSEKTNTSNRSRQNDFSGVVEVEHVDEYQAESIKPVKNKAGRPKKVATSTSRDTYEEPKTKRGRGRPKKKDRDGMPPPPLPQRSNLGLYQENHDYEDSQLPTSVEPEDTTRPNKRSKKGMSAPLTERDTNARVQGTKKSLWSQPANKPGSRTLQIMNENGPWQESTFVTKSGRRSIRPLEYWRGEEAQKAWDGEILDVWRAPAEEPKPKTRAKSGPRSRKGSAMPSIKEDEVDLEEWESNGEILTGLVSEWNNEQGIPDDEDYEVELAHSANSVQTREVVGAAFQYGKILNLPFFGAGIVEIPPNGYKREKNSRKMHMIFFIEQGKVDVTVAENSFTISKGGTWQVPRGNNYSIENPGDQHARIFFAQGCQPAGYLE